MMNCDLSKKYDELELKNDIDDEGNLFVRWNGRKIYFPIELENEIDWRFKALLKEQDVYSPHRYLDDRCWTKIRDAKLQNKNIVVIEVGAMEGMFSLELVDIADQIIIFEYDEKWIECLKNTFLGKGNVQILNKYVGKCGGSEEGVFALDSLDLKLDNTLLILKMDIEGAERFALEGARELIEQIKDFIGLICTYHRADDESIVREKFSGYDIYTNKGYFCFYVSEDYAEPYVRRCVLKIVN